MTSTSSNDSDEPPDKINPKAVEIRNAMGKPMDNDTERLVSKLPWSDQPKVCANPMVTGLLWGYTQQLIDNIKANIAKAHQQATQPQEPTKPERPKTPTTPDSPCGFNLFESDSDSDNDDTVKGVGTLF